MSSRTSSALLLLLAGCGERPADTTLPARVEADQRARLDDDGRVLCARGSAPLARACTLDREHGDAGLVLTLQHTDGGVRRLLMTRDDRGIVAADGAEPARVAVVGTDRIDVTLGGDRYRLPATIGTAR